MFWHNLPLKIPKGMVKQVLSWCYPSPQSNIELSLKGVPLVKLNPSFPDASLNVTVEFRNLFRVFRVRVEKLAIEATIFESPCASKETFVGEWIGSAGKKLDYPVKMVLSEGNRKRLTEQWDGTQAMPLVFDLTARFVTVFKEFDVRVRIPGPRVPDVWRHD